MQRYESPAPNGGTRTGPLARLLSDVKRRAYQRYRDRVAAGRPGDENRDWDDAEREVLEEAGLAAQPEDEFDGGAPMEEPGPGLPPEVGAPSAPPRDATLAGSPAALSPEEALIRELAAPRRPETAPAAAGLTGLTARDVMTSHVIAVGPECTLAQLAHALDERGLSAVPVVDANQRLLGVVSARDLVHLSAAADTSAARFVDHGGGKDGAVVRARVAGELLAGARVGDVCSRQMVVSPPDATLLDVCARMVSQRVHQVVIVEAGRAVGIVTALDVVKALSRQATGPAPETAFLGGEPR